MGLSIVLKNMSFFIFFFTVLYNRKDFANLLSSFSKADNSDMTLELQFKLIKGFKVFSQNDEDGAIQAVFNLIGVTDKIYVEFGVQNCSECNSRYLRENSKWDTASSLLMDGYHESRKINLHKVTFWPDNVLQLFTRFKVKKTFDFLSVDTDSYDFFMVEAILLGGFRPRVIMVEYNANFELYEAKSITPPKDGKSWEYWDGTSHHGCSLLAVKYLMERFGYSVVWCNTVNCMAVEDAAMGSKVRIDIAYLDKGPLDVHSCDYKMRPMAIIGNNGKWNGLTDEGEGSDAIRC